MNPISPYRYVLLRYRHDPLTEEFVNVAAVLHYPSTGFLDIRIRSAFARVLSMFPMEDRAATLKESLRHIAAAIRKYGRINKENLVSGERNLDAILQDVYKTDDGAFQWSSPGVGVTTDPKAALERLYERFITRYDARVAARRTDDEVWRAFRDQLEKRNIGNRLQEKVIRSATDELDFKFAWKNGTWHCVQPLSFDLANREGIRDKARRWTGHLTAISDSTDKFIPYFVLAAPKTESLRAEFEHAISILKKSPIPPEIYFEEASDQLVEQIVREIAEHDSSVSL